MKHTRFFSFLAIGFALLASVSCAGGNKMKESDLMHRRFVLESVNGAPYKSTFRTPEIEFGENFNVYGQVCNRYRGQGKLAGNVLTVGQMATTMMMCPDEELNKLERDFGQMMQNGAKAELTGNTLILSGSGLTLVYTASDWKQ